MRLPLQASMRRRGVMPDWRGGGGGDLPNRARAHLPTECDADGGSDKLPCHRGGLGPGGGMCGADEGNTCKRLPLHKAAPYMAKDLSHVDGFAWLSATCIPKKRKDSPAHKASGRLVHRAKHGRGNAHHLRGNPGSFGTLLHPYRLPKDNTLL